VCVNEQPITVIFFQNLKFNGVDAINDLMNEKYNFGDRQKLTFIITPKRITLST
jgi:hypothetical protein